MTWNIATPSGQENKQQGAPRIREIETDLQTALQAEGIFPGPTPASPIFIRTVPSGSTAQRPTPDTGQVGRWFYNSDTGTIQRDNGTSWDDLTPSINIIPSGTAMIFFESTAPSGWTQIVSGIGDRLIRAVIGGTGGTATAGDSISGPATHTHNTGSDSGTAHTHVINYTNNNGNFGTGVNVVSSLPPTTVSATIAHVHSLSAVVGFTPKYQDFIVCTRN